MLTTAELLAAAKRVVKTHPGRTERVVEARRVAAQVKSDEDEAKALAWLLGINKRRRAPDLEALGFSPDIITDLETLQRRRGETPEALMERLRRSNRDAVLRVGAARFRVLSEHAGDERLRLELVRHSRRLEMDLAARPKPQSTTEQLAAIKQQLALADDGLKRLAAAGYPIVLRLDRPDIQEMIQLLHATARLTGLLVLDLTCADPVADVEDIRALYNSDDDFTRRTTGALRMAVRRLDALGTKPETESDPTDGS